MSLDRHRNEIEGLFMPAILLYDANITIIGENGEIDPPAEKPWIRMSITIIDNRETCINNDKEETIGFFNVQVFTPLAQGAGEASKIVDEAKRILRSANLNAISFLNADVATGQKEDGWFHLLLRAKYRAID